MISFNVSPNFRKSFALVIYKIKIKEYGSDKIKKIILPFP
jgi:hypothetical protein